MLLFLLAAPHADAQTMVCRHLPKNVFFNSESPRGDENNLAPERYCPIRVSQKDGKVMGEELCPGETTPKSFVGTVVANPAYRGNVIVLWAPGNPLAEAALWAISFE